MPATEYHLPKDLPYPITITSHVAPPKSTILRNSPVLHYSYIYKHPSKLKPEKRIGTWEATFEGTISKWNMPVGMTVSKDSALKTPVVVVEQECTHELQYGGMCLMCEKDLTIDPDYNSTPLDDSRTMVPMTHTANGPTASRAKAKRIVNADNHRLLQAKKLSLIVDLDQTIVHATVDPTVGEWIAGGHAYEARLNKRKTKKPADDDSTDDEDDESDSDSDQEMEEPNPNWEALKDVSKFKLGPDYPAGGKRVDVDAGCDYYIKPRPGLNDFLAKLNEKYEMHVYTMGTRAYAEKVCSVIDKDKKYFNDRILSRDDSGSLTQKSIERLFPCDDSMVVIIDDRSDVWQNSVNLVKVIPYDFFIGIGDINATFLPKNIDPLNGASPASSSPSPAATTTPSSAPSPLPNAAAALTAPTEAMVTKQEAESAMAAKAQSEAVEATLEGRPLAKMQEALEAGDQEDDGMQEGKRDVPRGGTPPPEPGLGSSSPNGTVVADSPSDSAPSPKHKPKALLKNDDIELERVYKILNDIHERFFDEHEAVAASYGSNEDSEAKADVKVIISELKKEVFLGVHFLFSGVIPTNCAQEAHPAWKFAKEFGATCHTRMSSEITHLVANKPGTDKVMQALRRPNIKVVWAKWLYMCIALWKYVPITEEYLMGPASKPNPPSKTNNANGSGVVAEGGPTAADPPPSAPPSPMAEEDDGDEEDEDQIANGAAPDASKIDVDEDSERIEAPNDDVWQSLDKELEDFMDEDDGESVASASVSRRGSRPPSRSRDFTERDMQALYASAKEDEEARFGGSSSISGVPDLGSRKRRRRSSSASQSGTPSVNGSDDEDAAESPLLKRKRLAERRGASGLQKQVALLKEDDLQPVESPGGPGVVKPGSDGEAEESETSDDEASMHNSASDDDDGTGGGGGATSDEDDLFAGIGDDEWG